MDCSPLVIDNGYVVVDKKQLSQWVAQLLLGN